MKKALYIILIVVLLVAFGVSAFQVGTYLLEGKKQEDRYDELTALKEQAAAAATETTGEPEETEAVETTEEETICLTAENGMLLGYNELYEMNSDVVGWIRMEGTKMDYPVMQTPDSTDFYLYRNFDKENSTQGSIYAREVCDVFEPSDNITIYGHNMANGNMFACLNDYVDKEAWEYNSLIFFDTLYEYHTYKIFAVFKTTAALGKGFTYHQFVDAEDEEDFNEFVQTCKDLAFYDTGITPQYGDKMICLSTCEYTDPYGNGRLVVAAVRID